MAAFVAEFAACPIGSPTFWAGALKPMPALVAELRVFTVLKLALRAFHSSAFPWRIGRICSEG